MTYIRADMRLGIRLQLLLALGSLLVLAFTPLFFAVASLAKHQISAEREASARSIGRAVAAHVLASPADPPTRRAVLLAQVGEGAIVGLATFSANGDLALRATDRPELEASLPDHVAPGAERVQGISTAVGPALLVVVPSDHGESVAVVVRTGAAGPSPLVGLVGMYTGAFALALLVFTYFVMTRLVVRPIDALSRAAGKVADGARALDAPRRGARELVDLGSSLAQMTEKLRADEETLRLKIAEIERYAKDLKSAQERLVRSERLASVGRLAAGLAHEIGNPIAAILGFEELLLAGGLEPDEQRDFLERMKKETERVNKILRDLLDFARPAARESVRPGAMTGGSAPEPPPGSVHAATSDVLDLVAPQRGFKEIEVVTDLAPDLPRVLISHEQLVQVLLNLMLNAGDAVPRNGGRIILRAARNDKDGVRVEVEDNGPGVAPAVKDRLFEPFVTTKEVGKGTGLGLAVCRGLVEAIGGSIGVEPSGEGGARFVLDLPAEGAPSGPLSLRVRA